MRALLPSRRIVNMLGAIAYSLLILAYAVVAGITLMWLLNNGHLSLTTAPLDPALPAEVVQEETGDSTVSVLLEVVAYAITGLMLLTVLFVLVSLPYWLGKSGSYLLKRAIRLCKWSVTPMSLFVAKIIACGVVMIPVSMFIMQDISNLFSLIAIIVIVGFALTVFMLQHYLAKMTNIEAKHIW